MAQCYGITLQFQGSGTRSSVEHPSSAGVAAQTFLERSKAKRASYRKCRAEDGDVKPIMAPMGAVLGGQARQRRSESEGFSLMMT